jgi:hypothetical protein
MPRRGKPGKLFKRVFHSSLGAWKSGHERRIPTFPTASTTAVFPCRKPKRMRAASRTGPDIEPGASGISPVDGPSGLQSHLCTRCAPSWTVLSLDQSSTASAAVANQPIPSHVKYSSPGQVSAPTTSSLPRKSQSGSRFPNPGSMKRPVPAAGIQSHACASAVTFDSTGTL